MQYILDDSVRGVKHAGIDDNFTKHSKPMGYYDVDDAYNSKESFFKKYFFDYHFGRLEYYDDFLKAHLPKGGDILSVASGRSANELFLMEGGWRVTCSDLDIIKAYEKTKRLFPGFNYIKLNILEGSAFQNYDSVIALSLIYLFDNRQLVTFFTNVAKTLRPGGYLILDSAGAPDNTLSFFLHDVYLRCEAFFVRLVKSLAKGKSPGLIIKHHGYRRTDREIIETARSLGLELVTQKNYAFSTEFRRSIVFSKLVKYGSGIDKFFSAIGKKVPYVRMYKFRKE